MIAQEVRDATAVRPDPSPQIEDMMRNARDASDFLKALSHENRLMLLCLLSEQERSVSELEAILSLRQATVSQQLARLRYDNLVATRRDGKTIYYRIANDRVRRVVALMYELFCDARAKGAENDADKD